MKFNVISKIGWVVDNYYYLRKTICFLQLKSFGNFIFRFEYNEGHDIVFTEMKTFSILKTKSNLNQMNSKIK